MNAFGNLVVKNKWASGTFNAGNAEIFLLRLVQVNLFFSQELEVILKKNKKTFCVTTYIDDRLHVHIHRGLYIVYILPSSAPPSG